MTTCPGSLARGYRRAGQTQVVGQTALALVGPRLKQVFGLIERLFTLSVIVWIYVISVELIRS